MVFTACPPSTPTKRPYLRSDARRQQLLDVALALVDRVGLGHLTVSQLAQEAGVTRQTAYHHFADINELYREILRARFLSMQVTIAAVGEVHPVDDDSAVRRAAEIGIDLPIRDRQMLRYVFGGLEFDRPELRPLLHEIRALLILRWCSVLYPGEAVSARGQAGIWGAINAVFGMYNLLDSGAITRDDAIEVIVALAHNLPDRIPAN